MVSIPGMTNEETPLSREPFVFPSYRNVGPPYITTWSLPSLTIGLLVWLFSTPVISNACASDVSTPPTHQPHVNLSPSPVRSPSISPSSPSESSQVSSQIDKKKKKYKEKKKNQNGTKPPTTSNVGSKQLVIVNSTGSVDEVDKFKTKNLKQKFPYSLCKGDHFLRDCPSIPKVLEMWFSMSSASARHASDAPSTSDIKVGKKKMIVKLPCMLCEGDHYSHLCPRMDEASSLLEKLQLPTGYHKISPNPSLVDGMVNLVPSPVILVAQVVNLVSSSVEPLTKVVDLVPSSISSTSHLKSETQVVDPVSSLVNPTLHLKSANVVALVPSSVSPVDHVVNMVTSLAEPVDKVVDPIPYLVNPALSLESATQAVDSFPPIDPILPLENETQVVDLMSLSIDHTLPLESKLDTAHVFLVDTKSTVLGGIPLSLAKPPPSNEAILFYWGVLAGPRLPSHIPFNIIVKFCGWDVPQTLIDEGSSVSILSSIAWKSLGYPQLVSVTQTMFAFNRRTNHPLGILPQFPVTLGGKTIFIDVMVVQDPLDFDLLLGRYYVYAMKSIVSTFIRVISFPHDGRMVTIDQLSFVGPDLTINPMTSLNGSYQQSLSTLPQVNYVVVSPMPSVADENHLDPVVDMVISSVGILEPDLLNPDETLDMCSFQTIILPSSEDLLEAMTEFCPLTWCPASVLSSWKP
jgi:hypothetical protein